MRRLWVLTLGLAALATVQGCKQKPEPIPGPKARLASGTYMHTPGIAWFQGSLDEGFASPELPRSCREYGVTAPGSQELARARKKLSLPSSGVCRDGSCPPTLRPRHLLV
jgi:hypothetical protein